MRLARLVYFECCAPALRTKANSQSSCLARLWLTFPLFAVLWFFFFLRFRLCSSLSFFFSSHYHFRLLLLLSLSFPSSSSSSPSPSLSSLFYGISHDILQFLSQVGPLVKLSVKCGHERNGTATTNSSWNLSSVRDMCTIPRDEREHTGW